MASTTHSNGHAASNGVYRNGRASSQGHAPAAVRESGPDPYDLLWDGLPPAVTRELDGGLDPSLVSRRRGRGGRMYDYIEGHAVIAEANRIFGYGGWGYELAGDVALREFETVDSETGELRVVRAYSAPVRVTVPGAPPRTDVGFRTVVDETGEGHETACKGAVTDGMKRALRSFGDRFGNGLYDPRGGGFVYAGAGRVCWKWTTRTFERRRSAAPPHAAFGPRRRAGVRRARGARGGAGQDGAGPRRTPGFRLEEPSGRGVREGAPDEGRLRA